MHLKLEVKPNLLKSKYFRTKGNGAEKIRLEVTALNVTRWRLKIEGLDENGNQRVYYKDGSGNEDIDWDGKTNDAINPADDEYIARGSSFSLAPLQVTLSGNGGLKDIKYISIDNTPPEITVDKIEGNVIKGTINDISEIDVLVMCLLRLLIQKQQDEIKNFNYKFP